MTARKIPNVDFSAIPQEYEGYWVILRIGDGQQILGRGGDPAEAIRASGVSPDEPDVVLTEVPHPVSVTCVRRSDGSTR